MDVPNKPNAILNFNKSKFKVFAFKQDLICPFSETYVFSTAIENILVFTDFPSVCWRPVESPWFYRRMFTTKWINTTHLYEISRLEILSNRAARSIFVLPRCGMPVALKKVRQVIVKRDSRKV